MDLVAVDWANTAIGMKVISLHRCTSRGGVALASLRSYLACMVCQQVVLTTYSKCMGTGGLNLPRMVMYPIYHQLSHRECFLYLVYMYIHYFANIIATVGKCQTITYA